MKFTLTGALTLLFLAAMVFKLNANAPAWLWAANEGRNVYEEALTVATDANGNSYVGGYYNTYIYNLPHSDGPDAFIAKYNPAGNVTWKAAISDAGRERIVSVALDMVVDLVGNCYITGWFNGPKTGFDDDTLTNSSTNFADIFVAKYDPDGTVLWARSATGASGGTDKSYSITADKLGNSYITGDYNSTTLVFDTIHLRKLNNINMYIAKFATDGTVLWAKRAVGTGDSHGYAVAVDPALNCYVTGSFWSNLTMGTSTLTSAGNANIFVAKYAPDSTVLWVSASGGKALDTGTALITDQLGYCNATG
jgi:hypothetical protein